MKREADTPLEAYLRKNTNDRRAKYEARREAAGLVRVAVWVHVDHADDLKLRAKRSCESALTVDVTVDQ